MSEDPIYDMEKALVRLDGNRELFDDLVRFFLEDAPGLLAQVREGTQAGDMQQIERAAHTLKSLAGNFSAERARHAAERVERFARAAAVAPLAEAVQRMETEIVLLQESLRGGAPQS